MTIKTVTYDTIFNIFNYLFFAIFTFLCVYPFYYIFIYSLSDPILALKGITLIPAGFYIDNYITVFHLKGILLSAFISLARTLVGTIISIFCCSLFAYLLTKERLFLRKAIYRYTVITMYFNAGLIPYYLTIKAIGLRNTFLVYIIPFAVSAFYVVLLKTYIEQLPASLQESASIDGAGDLRIFFSIVIPISKPIMATIAVFASVAQWNSWFDTYIFVSNTKLHTLQYVLYQYLMQVQMLANAAKEGGANLQDIGRATSSTPESVRMTLTMVAVVPILCVYPFMQKHFVKGIMLGAIKG
jgi:putative aldouronate transport system permease protein